MTKFLFSDLTYRQSLYEKYNSSLKNKLKSEIVVIDDDNELEEAYADTFMASTLHEGNGSDSEIEIYVADDEDSDHDSRLATATPTRRSKSKANFFVFF